MLELHDILNNVTTNAIGLPTDIDYLWDRASVSHHPSTECPKHHQAASSD